MVLTIGKDRPPQLQPNNEPRSGENDGCTREQVLRPSAGKELPGHPPVSGPVLRVLQGFPERTPEFSRWQARMEPHAHSSNTRRQPHASDPAAAVNVRACEPEIP